MHSNNDKKDRGSSKGIIPSDRYERYSGSSKEMLEARERQRRESSKPDVRLGSCSSTGAGSSKGKS